MRNETLCRDRRDETVFIEEGHAMNRLVTALAEELHDQRGLTGRLQSPIIEHRDFERLEMNANV